MHLRVHADRLDPETLSLNPLRTCPSLLPPSSPMPMYKVPKSKARSASLCVHRSRRKLSGTASQGRLSCATFGLYSLRTPVHEHVEGIAAAFFFSPLRRSWTPKGCYEGSGDIMDATPPYAPQHPVHPCAPRISNGHTLQGQSGQRHAAW